jgi:hypothetical protein
MVVLGSSSEEASCTSRSGTPASRAAVMNAYRRVWSYRFADPGAAGDPPGTGAV